MKLVYIVKIKTCDSFWKLKDSSTATPHYLYSSTMHLKENFFTICVLRMKNVLTFWKKINWQKMERAYFRLFRWKENSFYNSWMENRMFKMCLIILKVMSCMMGFSLFCCLVLIERLLHSTLVCLFLVLCL